MDKFKDFYTRAMSDDAVRAEVKKILGKTPVEDATDEQLLQLGTLAKTLGINISLDEAKEYLGNADADEEGELSDEELEAVAGGKGGACQGKK